MQAPQFLSIKITSLVTDGTAVMGNSQAVSVLSVYVCMWASTFVQVAGRKVFTSSCQNGDFLNFGNAEICRPCWNRANPNRAGSWLWHVCEPHRVHNAPAPASETQTSLCYPQTLIGPIYEQLRGSDGYQFVSCVIVTGIKSVKMWAPHIHRLELEDWLFSVMHS